MCSERFGEERAVRERGASPDIMDLGSDRAFVEFGARGRGRSEESSIDSRDSPRVFQAGRLDCSAEYSSRGDVEFIKRIY